MEAIREQIKKPLVAGVIGFVVGLFIGLVILGWGLWPVKWTDASAASLREDLRTDYARMAIDSFRVNNDVFEAKERWDELGEAAPAALQAVKENPKNLPVEAINAFSSAVQPQAAAQLTPGVVKTEQADEGEKRSPLVTALMIMCGLTVLLALAFGAFYFLRGRTGPLVKTPAMEAQEAARQAEWTDYESTGQEKPIAQFMASYKLGDDLFDESFSIDSPTGEFLGECGVGISETIGVGDPKKVTSFEVWLFDKNDIQTVTKVLMSEHAYSDEALRQRLSAKGEPVPLAPNSQVVLQTATLRLTARVVDQKYGEGALPENSFFESLILELAIWQI